ncbi:protein phosphatase [Lithospermum erythrorhizon]|uniref:protein-serine/threonine phosphatase n=1 Tax=Lithospermum erythrorhizon TaxID=34254 RepID=A0AAV3QUV3_LITER
MCHSNVVQSLSSGSHSDIGPRSRNEDSHIQIDDLSTTLDFIKQSCPHKSGFYALFDGHGGSEASSYLKENAMKLFFQDIKISQEFLNLGDGNNDDSFSQELKKFHAEAFRLADQAIADEGTIDEACGTTALTAMFLGKRLMIANAGDSRAILCSRGGVFTQLTEDHRPDSNKEKKRVEESGGFIEDGYLNGELGVTRALGDWFLKYPNGEKSSPLISEPDVFEFMLSDDDEFLIIACDGLWDVLSNQEAVNIVRKEMKMHGDPRRCAQELVYQAMRRDSADNVTVIVVSLTSSYDQDHHVPVEDAPAEESVPQRPRFKFSALSEEARSKLRCLLEAN